jgi:putative transposase
MVNNIGLKNNVINGRGIKSYNQYWNKEMSKYRSALKKKNKLDRSKRLQRLTDKRNFKMDYFMHCTSKYLILHCIDKDIGTIIIGKNIGWKQESKMSTSNNQKFIQIPYESFIKKMKYKCEEVGIKVIENEECYTSGTSYLDGEAPIKSNYDKSRRVYRGLFISNTGIKINADVNGAYQIMRKVFSNVKTDEIVGVHLHPVIINI